MEAPPGITNLMYIYIVILIVFIFFEDSNENYDAKMPHGKYGNSKW